MNLREEIEEILRNQFVDRAFDNDGNTTWGIFNTREKLLALFNTAVEEAKPKLKFRNPPNPEVEIEIAKALSDYHDALKKLLQ